uniref:Uncharacterized protein n=1 Tax=Macaca fascicularis TaxID=9541 RepID=A0A7N9CMD4_MACFA
MMCSQVSKICHKQPLAGHAIVSFTCNISFLNAFKLLFYLKKKKQKTFQGQAWWLTPVTAALWEAKVGRSLEVRSSRPAGQHGETLSLLKIQKISQAWWCVPAIPATWEGEAGESLEPGKQRAGISEPRSHHCTPDWVKEQDSISKKQNKTKQNK